MKLLKVGIHNLFAEVDDIHYERLLQYHYTTSRKQISRKSKHKIPNKRKNVTLANDVLQIYYIMIDHKDRNYLNNQSYNLRPSNYSLNRANTVKTLGFTSKYKGVGWNRKYKLWHARIVFNRKTIYLGRFEKETDAALAYNTAAIKYFGEHAVLNIVLS